MSLYFKYGSSAISEAKGIWNNLTSQIQIVFYVDISNILPKDTSFWIKLGYSLAHTHFTVQCLPLYDLLLLLIEISLFYCNVEIQDSTYIKKVEDTNIQK